MNKVKCVILVLLLTSCVKDVDFNQAEELTLTPVFESSVVYFNEPASVFFVNDVGEEVAEAQDATVIDVFNDDFLVNNLEKAVFTFKITNSVNRRFEIRVGFLNLEEEVQHSFALSTGAAIANEDIETDYIEVFEGDALTNLKATKKIVFTAILAPSDDGSVIDENTLGRIELKSKATFYLNIKTSE